MPYGLDGGECGAVGKAEIVSKGKARSIGSKGTWELDAGDRVRIETPEGESGRSRPIPKT